MATASARRNGRRATFYDPRDGSRYRGEWHDDVMDGEGSWSDGRLEYVGQWRNGQRHGHGVLSTVPQSGSHNRACTLYEGDWNAGRMHGYGTRFYEDGSRYEGEWRGGLREGSGKILYNDGSSYQGQWSADKRHGNGIHTLANGNQFEGEWRQDVKEGNGIYRDHIRHRSLAGYWKADQCKCGEVMDLGSVSLPPIQLAQPDQVLRDALAASQVK